MELRAEVCAELAIAMAYQSQAQEQGLQEVSQAWTSHCQALLENDTSYVPYRLKARVRSSSEKGSGFDLLLQFKRNKEAQAMHEYDGFPAS
jgi:hypothetical protein